MLIKDKNKASGLIWIEKLSVLLDSKFTLPGTRFKYGLDPILGLLPIVGDLTSFTISCVLIIYMARFGVSRKVLLMMAGNIIIDTVLGAIPILGNLFDFTFKANNRNVRLLKKHYEEGKYQGSGTGIILTILFGLILVVATVVYLLVLLSKLLINLF